MSKRLSIGGKTKNSLFFLGWYTRTIAICIGTHYTISIDIRMYKELHYGFSMLLGLTSPLDPNPIDRNYIGISKWQAGFGIHLNPIRQKHTWNKDKFINVTSWPFSD